jgi:hypothetical protein
MGEAKNGTANGSGQEHGTLLSKIVGNNLAFFGSYDMNR